MCGTFEKTVKSKEALEASQQLKVYLPSPNARHRNHSRRMSVTFLDRPTLLERFGGEIRRNGEINRINLLNLHLRGVEIRQQIRQEIRQERSQEIEKIEKTKLIKIIFPLFILFALFLCAWLFL